MIGKAKIEFEKFILEKNTETANVYVNKSETTSIPLDLLKEDFKLSLIIEWLDSVGIYIFTRRLTMSLEFKEWYFIITNSDGVHLNNHVSKESRILKDSRQEATEAAIKKAVDIYNEKYT
ncbi:hypothetical protein [Elizabethkingia anophelis]|uniref:hypothetical protein n=1 Tax=Elizabethkingia anophelis TaxID=1117645 RepID=UPI00389142D0